MLGQVAAQGVSRQWVGPALASLCPIIHPRVAGCAFSEATQMADRNLIHRPPKAGEMTRAERAGSSEATNPGPNGKRTPERPRLCFGGICLSRPPFQPHPCLGCCVWDIVLEDFRASSVALGCLSHSLKPSLLATINPATPSRGHIRQLRLHANAGLRRGQSRVGEVERGGWLGGWDSEPVSRNMF
ncbi:hypothetical protein BT67DRAFT_204467 [Trichocladium antarcticum]|uniref:Uncharacterized protein n=1 Tax=Trichocladium antarcticum TaxID=1450529 RepID=A0AAN6UD83_9PEZI|nr:hypothetical protein BT67DRAFT_204467 [Trichocladium antarcticum]